MWGESGGKSKRSAVVQSGFLLLTLSRLRSYVARQHLLGLLQSSDHTEGSQALTRWEWGRGEQDLLSHPGDASKRSQDESCTWLFLCLLLKSICYPAMFCSEVDLQCLYCADSLALWLLSGFGKENWQGRGGKPLPFPTMTFFLYQRPWLLQGGSSSTARALSKSQ